jgi:hypothetical protein
MSKGNGKRYGIGHNRGPRKYFAGMIAQERDRLTFDVLRACRGENNTQAAAGVVSPSTIANWRKPVDKGGTRFPQAITLNAVLHAHGKKLGIVDL